MNTKWHWSVLLLRVITRTEVRASGGQRNLPAKAVECDGKIDGRGTCIHTSYGVDVSFPYQHHEFSTLEVPFSDSQQSLYNEYMQGCRDYYSSNPHSCDDTEQLRIEMNLNQPRSLQNFTETGYKKIRAPTELWTLVQNFWESNKGSESVEPWEEGDIFINHWASPTYHLSPWKENLESGGYELVDSILEAARPTFEDWIGQELAAPQLYGVIIYKDGSVMSPHLDRKGLVASAILNVAQDLDEPWNLEVIDRKDGTAKNVTIEPGEMLLYEGQSLLHGRPFPLHGRFFANLFIHFELASPPEEIEECPEHYEVEYKGIQNYLNPRLFEDPEILEDIGRRLRNGELVVIKNAFLPEYANAMHCDLDSLTAWELNTGYAADGFHYNHHNIYEKWDFSRLMNETQAMFEHPETKKFMSELSGRDCFGDSEGSEGAASYYMPGDHSLPHCDYDGQRSVAYVWHLSRNWRPEWGGALYWIPEHIANSFVHASYNTLSLFSVRTTSSHLVTTVSPHATEKRLAFNGWMQSAWEPSVEDDLEDMLSNHPLQLTASNYNAIEEIIDDEESGLDPERRQNLESLKRLAYQELFPDETTAIHSVGL